MVDVFARVTDLVEWAASLCNGGELSAAAEAYRLAAAEEARGGDMERALVWLRMSSALRLEQSRWATERPGSVSDGRR